jgi:hypothetical protein
MVRLGEGCSWFRRSILGRRRATLLAGLAAVLAVATTPGWSGEEELPAAVPQVAVVTPAETEGNAAPASITVGKEPEAGADRTSDRQRRVLMLLIMNSAGPVRPFGNLGR